MNEMGDDEAARVYRLRADQGDAEALYNLGVFYEQGRGGLPKDEREAARRYKLAADQGHAKAQNKLGIFYAQGRGGLPKRASSGSPPTRYMRARSAISQLTTLLAMVASRKTNARFRRDTRSVSF
jgi:TPR repeat protein